MAIKTETIRITGMTCMHCKGSVSRILSDVKGISSVEVSLENKNATITYDDSLVNHDEIIHAVNETQTYHAE